MKIQEFKKLIREEVRKVLKEAGQPLDPNATYMVQVGTSRGEFDPGEVKKVTGEPSMVAKGVVKAIEKEMRDNDYDEDDISEYLKAFKLDQDTYFVITGEEGVTIVGRPKSKKYGQFWSLIDSDADAAANMFDTMDNDSVKSQQIY